MRTTLAVVSFLIFLSGLALLVGLLLGGCTCRFDTRPAPANPVGAVLVVERCQWGTAGMGEGRP